MIKDNQTNEHTIIENNEMNLKNIELANIIRQTATTIERNCYQANSPVFIQCLSTHLYCTLVTLSFDLIMNNSFFRKVNILCSLTIEC
jgi:hypothetical protein